MTRLTKLVAAVALLALAVGCQQASVPASAPAHAPPTMTVYKSPTCGCCGTWVDHLRADGFAVTVVEEADVTPRKQALGVPVAMASCHTAVIGGYVIEGHVPAADIRRLLAEQPDAAGLAVPGMPIGSPGMEMGERRDPYTVWQFDRDRAPRAFAQHGDS